MSLKDMLYIDALDRLNDQFERDLSEIMLLLFFFISGVYFLYGSFEFGRVSQWFPQMTSIGVVVGCALLLVKNFMPEPIRQFIDADPDITGGSDDEELTKELDLDAEPEPEPGEETTEAIAPGTLIVLTPPLMLGYILASYYIGMLWASPVFVFVYLMITKQRWYTIVTLVIVSMLLVYLFIWALNLDLHTGVWLPEGFGILEELGLV